MNEDNKRPRIFNKKILRSRRNRNAATFAHHDFLHKRVMHDIVDRLETINRKFPLSIFFGAGDLTSSLTPKCQIGTIVNIDAAPKRLPEVGLRLAADEETAPLAPRCANLIVSLLTLHSANDLVGALAQSLYSLKPDGLYLAALFGEETLSNLKASLYAAEVEILGGASPRVAPFATLQDCGRALSRAGFALPVTDIDRVQVKYDNPSGLFADLRAMGETNALSAGVRPLRKDVINKAVEYFKARGGAENFEIIYLTGWAPHGSQQKPLKPGSANVHLGEALRNIR